MVIQTQPGLPVVSSVFFMCLPGKVLVYGDCAINSNPSSEELAAIAVASADTAAAFGITPRVAMLSYATGDSNTGGCSHLSEPLLTLPITTQRPCDGNSVCQLLLDIDLQTTAGCWGADETSGDVLFHFRSNNPEGDRCNSNCQEKTSRPADRGSSSGIP